MMFREPVIHQVFSVHATAEDGVFIVNLNMTDAGGERYTTDNHCFRLDDPYGINPLLRQWLATNPHTVLPHDEVK